MAAFKLKTKHGKFVIDLNKVTAVRFATDGSIHILIDSQKLRFEIENIEKAMKLTTYYQMQLSVTLI